MKSLCVVGMQWGDEGKGKIIDALAPGFDYVVRWNGGNNAGHTVVVNAKKFPLSLVPSGVLHNRKLLISQGVVITPSVLLEELSFLQKQGFRPDLTIDPRCHVVMPYHKLLDRATELWKGKEATGSLHLGIGYCYEDRNNRMGIRMEDLVQPKILKEKIELLLPIKIAIIERVYGLKTNLAAKAIFKEYLNYGKKLARYVGDVSSIVAKNQGTKAFLFEQAHGTMLDPVFGTYPFTVAPPTIAPAVFSSIGAPSQAADVLGVVKAYTTRVGNGPFPTELHNAVGDSIRKAGAEFGTVSGRPRRCGWLDLPQLRYAVRLNGCTALAVTKLDVLSGLDELRICTHYQYRGKRLTEFPDQIGKLSDCTPAYVRFSGWKQDISAIRKAAMLPQKAKQYLSYIEKALKTPIKYISVAAERSAIIKL